VSNNHDDWDDYYEAYFEDRIEEYLEKLDSDPYKDYYSTKKNNKNGDEVYKSLLRTYVKDLSRITEKLKPTSYTVISGSGPAWFYEPTTRKFIKTERGSEVVVVPGGVDESGNLLVRTLSTFLMVPEAEILDIGYN
jgi:hypothetical protein|tara:strand:+ start:522 stop:929 length:408 start_codon:yes stop_codon:yes gene_type:complete